MPSPLTPFETQILGLAARGHSPRDIAHQLGVEERVVRNAIARIRRLLSARDLHHAVQIHQTSQEQS
ncbi:helix-turn-helix domain-containing protein [Kitasatospora sp. NBC_01302]|uniref:helix-turn-helix domain-containing protein n=1 Tax=Kitasatospora sp. NBC_01302 TaxID=2903575 RepID=UPI002E141E8C|nr:helix-turn-helix transcriptional regulator [Kitasatospora sp. NBC_01302]